MPEPTKPTWEARLADAAARIEQEVRTLVETVDRDVVPEVRKHSSSALRNLSARFSQMADHLDEARKDPPPPKDAA